MTKAVAVLVTLIALLVPVASVNAAATSTTWHFTTLVNPIPVTCAGPFTGITLAEATGNGVGHFTVNSTGDWFTFTFAGDGTVTGALPGTVFSGHITVWFGSEDNNQNTVQHAIFAFHGVNVADPSQTLQMEAHFNFTVNANGVVTATPIAVSCH